MDDRAVISAGYVLATAANRVDWDAATLDDTDLQDLGIVLDVNTSTMEEQTNEADTPAGALTNFRSKRTTVSLPELTTKPPIEGLIGWLGLLYDDDSWEFTNIGRFMVAKRAAQFSDDAEAGFDVSHDLKCAAEDDAIKVITVT